MTLLKSARDLRDSTFNRSCPMPKHVKKANLPTKPCAACNRPFTWRKKWEKDWDEVRFCSEKCRRNFNR